MSDNHQAPRLSRLRSTRQILKQTTGSFTTNPITFLFLSLFLFSFRTVVENGTHQLTTFIDRDASLKALLSRLDLSGTNNHHRNHHLNRRRRRNRPFLHLTRVGTLDDDFFSGDDDIDPSLFNYGHKKPLNGTIVSLSNFEKDLGFSDLIADNGIRFHETVRFGMSFKASRDFDYNDDDDNVKKEDENVEEEDQEKDRVIGSSSNERGLDRVMDLQFFMKGLELGRQDAGALFFLVSFLSAAYGLVILGFTVIYSWVLGIVFVAVVNDLIGRFSSFFCVAWDGSRLGLKRLTGCILMRWTVRDGLTQLMGLWYFGEIEDQYSFFKLFVRLKLMPFSIMSPWIRGFEKEISGFLFTWFLLDTLVSFIFAVVAWVALVDTRRSGREIVREGFYLISTMLNQAVQLKCIEAILCGSFARWALSHAFGKLFAAVFQSAAESTVKKHNELRCCGIDIASNLADAAVDIPLLRLTRVPYLLAA
ncbi:hypothetical protein ACFE04_000544 [Oxalis oulophora]